MNDINYTTFINSRCDTFVKFAEYKKVVCNVLQIDSSTYEKIKKYIIKFFGFFYKVNTYCGPGWLGDKLVPDFIFKFAGYVHDGLYYLIEIGIIRKDEWKNKADKWFFAIMDTKSAKYSWPINKVFKAISRVYYTSVMIAGNPKLKARRCLNGKLERD